MVGLEKTFYEVSELVGMVEVCTIVFVPTVCVCPIQFSFNVTFSTADNLSGNTTYMMQASNDSLLLVSYFQFLQLIMVLFPPSCTLMNVKPGSV